MCTNMFLKYILAGYPLLWVETYEEFRALTTLAKEMGNIKDEYSLFSWDVADGLKAHKLMKGLLSSAKVDAEDPITEPEDILTWASQTMPENSILCLLDYHHYAKKGHISRKIRNLIPQFKANGKVLVIVSYTIDIPPEIEKEITVIPFKLPDVEQLRIVLKGVCESADPQPEYPKNDLPILEAALGMTSFEAENAFSVSLIEKKCFDMAVINKEKAAIVKKTGLLEVIEAKETIDDIGGLENLKTWLNVRKDCFSQEAKNFGVKPPKGLLLIGVPGTGKSLSAKVVAGLINRPLLRLEMGKVFGSYVGESESNIRKCLHIAEAVAPCLTGDTQVLLANGQEMSIKQLFETYPEGGFEVVSYDSTSGNMTVSNVLKVTKKTTTDTYQVQYSDGNEIGYSWNHLQPVMRDGRVSWIKTEDIVIGDFVATPLGELELASINFKDYLPPNCRFYKKYSNKKNKILSSYEKASIIAYGKGGYTDSLLYQWPKNLSDDLFYLLGLILSDGSISNNQISFTNSEKDLINIFKNKIKDLFNIDCTETYVDAETARKNGQGLKQLKDSNFKEFWIVRFHSKIVSFILKKMTEHLRGFNAKKIKNFLAGYIDGDGCIISSKYPRIIFCSHNKERVYLIKSLLKRCNIMPSFDAKKGLTISGNQVQLLKDLPLGHPKKKLALICLNIPETRADRVVVFPIGRMITEMREECSLSSNKFKYATSSEIHAWEHNLRPVPKNRLEDLKVELFLKGHNKWAETFSTILNSPLKWTKVINIRKTGAKEVYDLCCEKNHNFLANGILTHNCCLWIDELEKSFSGLKGNGSDGSGVTKRVFASFLTWLQEKTADVLIVATANDVNALPPEMLRLGRFDKIFWVDLPDEKQRKEIIEIHLSKVDRKVEDFDIPSLIKASEKFTGSEIEVWIKESLVLSFSKKIQLNTEDLIETSKSIVPIAQLMYEDIEKSRQWAKERGITYASIVSKGLVTIETPKNRKISFN